MRRTLWSSVVIRRFPRFGASMVMSAIIAAIARRVGPGGKWIPPPIAVIGHRFASSVKTARSGTISAIAQEAGAG